MPDAALQQALSDLAAVTTRLNEESNTLNVTIAEFEKTLTALNPGIAVWCPNPIRLQTHTPLNAFGSLLGFDKIGDDWGLWIHRTGLHRAKPTNAWEESADHPAEKLLPLTDATREERIGALAEFKTLVEMLTTEAKKRLEMIERANKQGVR